MIQPVILATSPWLDSKAPEVPHLLSSRGEGKMFGDVILSAVRERCSASIAYVILSCFCVPSSLYFDEDGDLAHEFYEETVVTKNGRRKSKLKRIQKNLIPQV